MIILWQLAENQKLTKHNIRNIWRETISEAVLQGFEDNYPVIMGL